MPKKPLVKFILLLGIFIIQLNTVKAQNSKLDSLISGLLIESHDSILFRKYFSAIVENSKDKPMIALKLCSLAENLALKNKWEDKNASILVQKSSVYSFKGKIDSSLIYSDEAIKIYKKLKDINGEFAALSNRARCYFQVEDFKMAILELTNALKLENKVSDKQKVGGAYSDLGLAYQYTNDFQKALENNLIGLKIREKHSPRSSLAKSHDNLGIIYFELGDFSKAIEHYNLGLEIYQEMGDTSNMLRRNYAIGGAFYGKGEYETALDYLNGALSLAKETNRLGIQINSYQVIGLIHIKKDEFLKAQDVLQRAESIFPADGPKRMLVFLKSNLSVLYLNWGTKVKKDRVKHLNLAIKTSLEALEITEDLGLLSLGKKSKEVLYKAYEELGNNEKAMFYVKGFIVLKDSILNEQKQKEILALEAKFETEKKDLKIDLLNKDAELANLTLAQNEESQKSQQFIIYMLLGSAIIAVLIGLLIFRLYKQKQKTNLKLSEQYAIILKQKDENEALLKEIHHRVKNNLQIISSLLDLQSRGIEDQKTKLAVSDGQNRVQAMSLIHEMLYQNENMSKINIQNYISKLYDQILSINSLGKKPIERKINISKDFLLDIDTAIPLGLILTELLTNAFKYAFKDLEEGSISIKITEDKNRVFRMEVADSGLGLPEDFQFQKAKSLGLRLVRNLSKQINGTVDYAFDNGSKFTVNFQSDPKPKPS